MCNAITSYKEMSTTAYAAAEQLHNLLVTSGMFVLIQITVGLQFMH